MQSSSSLQLVKPSTPVKVVAAASIVEQHQQASTTTATRSAAAKNANDNNNIVDFIGPSNAVKHLFSLPYNSDRNVSVALHNMGNGTLLLDSGEDFGGGDDSGSAAAAIDSINFTPRSRRRRQRPSSWSTKEEYVTAEEGEDAENLNQSQLAQLREGERSLLASLSLLLEEDKRQQQLPLHHKDVIVSDERAFLNGDIIEVVSPSRSGQVEGILPDTKKDHALVVPSNAIVVANKQTDPISTTTQTNSTRDPNNHDPLMSKLLPPPQHYLSHVVAPPTEPRQYVDWEFHDMKLLIASDAVIYNHGKGGATGAGQQLQQQTNNCGVGNVNAPNVVADEINATTMSEAIAIRVADASDLKSQMKYHENMVKRQQGRGPLDVEEVGSDGRNYLLHSRHHGALPPSSYAEALKLTPSPTEEDDPFVGQESTTSGRVKGDENNNALVDGKDTDVKLQTCMIPASGASTVGPEWAQLGFSISPYPPASDTVTEGPLHATAIRSGGSASSTSRAEAARTNNDEYSSPPSPVCTVLDAYLDNLTANVPQLALILREHGFVQNIKLLRTEDIPSLMMHPSTLGVADNAPTPSSSTTAAAAPLPPVFDPAIVEMNAAMLLRFLKSNCTSDNSTYLLHRAAGTTNIQLFDITSISERRVQRKWVWWLALCSYRFACRLEQLQTNVLPEHLDGVTRREYRHRQRSLLLNTLNLLEELADMDSNDNDGGRRGRHETIVAAVCEHLADTYLWNNDDNELQQQATAADGDHAGSKTPAPCASSSQPYPNVTVDCLDKAYDHLMNGIKKLTPLLSKAKQKQQKQDSMSIEIESISMQLYGIHHKIVNVCLRLADHHLLNYFSSNLIRSLRTAARTLSDACSLLEPLDIFEFRSIGSNGVRKKNDNWESNPYARSILLHYAWLWEYCGHFARSFAADGLWRDRGHTCGADLIGLFREVNASCCSIRKACFGKAAAGSGSRWKPQTTCSVCIASHGQVSLDSSLTGLVILPHDFEQIDASVLQKEGCHEAIGAARAILNRKTQIKRDARQVLVAACVCYGHAIDAYVFLVEQNEDENTIDTKKKSVPLMTSLSGFSKNNAKDSSLILMAPSDGGAPLAAPLLRQRLGDACNEIGKILLSESRAVLSPQFTPPDELKSGNMTVNEKSFGMSHVSAIMLASAQFWFLEGLARFTEGNDMRNLALLRCNLCQCCKIRANSNVILPGSSSVDSRKKNAESHLQEAVDHLVAAHEAMGQRDADPVTWDMVSEELAATLLILGVRRRQSTLSSSSPEPLMLQAMRLTPGEEKAIIEPMERSCKIYESLGTTAPRASHQAAAAHYQLALYFSKVWTCQRDEAKTREKLAAAFKHYGLAHQYFFQHVRGNETTFVVLSLDFSNLYSAVSGEEECLLKALFCCLDTCTAFSFPLAREAALASTIMEQMTTLADNVEARISKLLLNLVKIEKDRNSKPKAVGQKSSPSEKYKNLYRKVLTYKMKMTSGNNKTTNSLEEGSENPLPPTFHIFELLQTLSQELH